jgi:ParB family transcriptional regulator, chromosome partitioning protein
VSAKPTGLGRGFDSLIPQDFDDQILQDEKDRIKKLFIADIIPNPDQPRTHFDNAALQELAASIKRFGILQPLIVTPGESAKYKLVAGERRWRAAKLAGLMQVPAIVRERAELEQLEVALIENVQRVDLSPLEQAVSIERLHQQFNFTYKSIADRLGKALPTIHNTVRLLQLPAEAREALAEGRITEGHARAVLALKDQPARQIELLNLIIQNHWSVRQAEQYVTANREGIMSPGAAKKRLSATTPETMRLSSYVKAPVSIRRTAKGGKLEIGFKSDEDLARIISRLDKP